MSTSDCKFFINATIYFFYGCPMTSKKITLLIERLLKESVSEQSIYHQVSMSLYESFLRQPFLRPYEDRVNCLENDLSVHHGVIFGAKQMCKIIISNIKLDIQMREEIKGLLPQVYVPPIYTPSLWKRWMNMTLTQLEQDNKMEDYFRLRKYVFGKDPIIQDVRKKITARISSETFDRVNEEKRVKSQVETLLRELDHYQVLAYMSTRDFLVLFRERWFSTAPVSPKLIKKCIIALGGYSLKLKKEKHSIIEPVITLAKLVLPTPPLSNGPLPVNIDFDEGSEEWRSNKRVISPGVFEYIEENDEPSTKRRKTSE